MWNRLESNWHAEGMISSWDRKGWASVTPEWRADRSWGPGGVGSTVTLCSPVPLTLAHALLHSGRCSHFWTILKHSLQNSNTPVKLMCMLFLVFSTFPHSTLTNPSLAWHSTGFICQSYFQAFPTCIFVTPTGPCTMINPYCCSVGI